LTGWAQVNGRDELSIEDKVRFDAEYLSRRSLHMDIGILWKTFAQVAKREGVTH
jgi:O-antigen biosynthesis protein WbqP